MIGMLPIGIYIDPDADWNDEDNVKARMDVQAQSDSGVRASELKAPEGYEVYQAGPFYYVRPVKG